MRNFQVTEFRPHPTTSHHISRNHITTSPHHHHDCRVTFRGRHKFGEVGMMLGASLLVAQRSIWRVMLECPFSCQAQHLVKFWKIAGVRNVVLLNAKCVSKAKKSPRQTGRCEMSSSCSVHFISNHVRIMVESAAI